MKNTTAESFFDKIAYMIKESTDYFVSVKEMKGGEPKNHGRQFVIKKQTETNSTRFGINTK